MYLWHIVYNLRKRENPFTFVVNCFQNVSLAYRLQLKQHLLINQLVVNCFQNVSLAYRLQFANRIGKTVFLL